MSREYCADCGHEDCVCIVPDRTVLLKAWEAGWEAHEAFVSLGIAAEAEKDGSLDMAIDDLDRFESSLDQIRDIAEDWWRGETSNKAAMRKIAALVLADRI